MRPLSYSRVDTVEDAVALGREPGTAFLAGGTTEVDLIRAGMNHADHQIDINDVPLTAVEDLPDGGLRIGALARMSDVARTPSVKERFPAISRSLLLGASEQLRNMASMGGNMLQRTRCAYLRDGISPCNKREPGSGCSAIEGFNRGHAILGTSEHCIALHPSDVAIALVAFDAVIHTTEQSLPFADFFLLPGDTPQLEHPLVQGELITAIEVPGLPLARHSIYLKFRDRQSYEFALVSVCAAIEVRDGVVEDVRLALGGVGTKPWRFRRAESALIGGPAEPEAFRLAALLDLEEAIPRAHNAFKVELAARAAVRGLTEAMR
jgi:xanthine dehydrogenase YagS FAD-binding subunit